MKTRDPGLLAGAAAALFPVMISLTGWQASVATGILVLTAFSALLVFFGAAKQMFPPSLRGFAVVLGAAAAAQIAYDVWGIHPVWAASVLLLFPWECLRVKRRSAERMELRKFLPAVVFFVLAILAGLCQELFGRKIPVRALAGPSGILLFLALFSVFWQNRAVEEGPEEAESL
jgi:hypothetical protein